MSKVAITMQMWWRWSLNVDAWLCITCITSEACLHSQFWHSRCGPGINGQSSGNDFCNTIEAQLLTKYSTTNSLFNNFTAEIFFNGNLELSVHTCTIWHNLSLQYLYLVDSIVLISFQFQKGTIWMNWPYWKILKLYSLGLKRFWLCRIFWHGVQTEVTGSSC